MDSSLLDRNDVIRSMHLGWMVLDKHNKVVDANPFVEIITGLSFDNLKGRSVDDWLINSNVLLNDNDSARSSFLTHVNLNGFTYVFEVFSQLLRDSDNNLTGRLLLWQDVTEQKRLEEARHRVLSTKINLMRSISSAANHITDIKIFLDAAIFQIVSSFGCLAGFIFVRDSDFIGDEKAGFRLESVYSYEGLLDNVQIAQNFGKYIEDLSLDSQTGQIEDVTSGLFLAASESLVSGNLLMCPIMIDESLQGVVCLFREQDHPYHEDEVVGLEMITNEISMLIYVDHQRHLAVSFSERKKLVKDLHDTVTQQLYGLLYQIEVAQAHAELDDSDKLQGSLARIADIARQALREMRLFLHELKPVDVKTEGLVSALHHRLIAVEGRANVHPRFISPESLEISMQQEINLYYIAREALNNVLRHSHAKTVLVQLNQTRESTRLEIMDDGVGFDVSLMETSGGMGLKNIQAWVSQIHASLEVNSIPGNGTTLRIVVPRTA